ncbi:MAG: ATP synthase F1 subunit delta [Ghiorsea sp.]
MSAEASIARRYATALFELHQEGTELLTDLSKVAEVASNEDAKALLVNTQISASDRAAIVLKAAAVDSECMSRLLVLLCSRNKAQLVGLIHDALDQMIREANAKVMVDVTVATALGAQQADKLKDVISQGIGKQVDLNVATDTAILGGLILNIGDRQIDHSVRGRLVGLKRAMSV